MKRVFAVVVLAAALLAVSGVGWASDTNWWIYAQVSNPDGSSAGVYNDLGVKPSSVDGTDSNEIASSWGTVTTVKVAASKIGAVTNTCYDRNFMSTASYATYPNQEKIWSFRVSGLSQADTTTPIKLVFKTMTATAMLNPVAVPNVWEYKLRLKNDQGQEISKPTWAGGGVWAENTDIVLNIPLTANTYFAEFSLPTITLSANTHPALLTQGYEIEFIQGAVPEPGSLMILGTGLAGLVGLVSRRRRA